MISYFPFELIYDVTNLSVVRIDNNFPKSTRVEWPLTWWGIVKPIDELLDLHDEKVAELGYEVPLKTRRANSLATNSSNAQAGDSTANLDQKYAGKQRCDVGSGRNVRPRHEFREGRERTNNYLRPADRFNHPGDVSRPPNSFIDNNWRHGPDRGRRSK